MFAPIIMASNTRGKRISHMMVSFTAVDDELNNVFIISGTAIVTLPNPIAITATTIVSEKVKSDNCPASRFIHHMLAPLLFIKISCDLRQCLLCVTD